MNSVFSTWNAASRTVVDQLWTAAWQGGLAILIAWGAIVLWKNAAPRVRCWLWRIAFAKLLLALAWLTPWEWAVLPAEDQVSDATAIAELTDEKTESVDAAPSGLFNTQSQPSGTSAKGQPPPYNGMAERSNSGGTAWQAQRNAINGLAKEIPAEHQIKREEGMRAPFSSALFDATTGASPSSAKRHKRTAAALGWPFWVVFVWVIGVVFGIVLLAAELYKARRLVRGATAPHAAEVVTLRREIAAKLGLRRPPVVRFSGDIPGPMLTGVLRPTVLIPLAWRNRQRDDKFRDGNLRMALTHEFAHVRRRDLFWNWLPTLTRILFFFHPLVWLATRRWTLDVEQACDELAVDHGRLPRLRYAEFLVWIVAPRRLGLAQAALGAASPFSHLKRRLLAMKNQNAKPRRLWLAVGGAAALGLAVLIPVKLTAQDGPPDPGKQKDSSGSGASSQSQAGEGKSGASQSGGATAQSSGGSGTTQSAGTNEGRGGIVSQSGGGGTAVQSSGGRGANTQSAGEGRGGIVSQSGGGGTAVQSSGGRGANTQSAGAGEGSGGVVQSSGGRGAAVQGTTNPFGRQGVASGGSATTVTSNPFDVTSGSSPFGRAMASSETGEGGTTTISISEGGKSFTVKVKSLEGDKVSVTVTRKEGDNTTINQFALDKLEDLKEKDEEAFDVYKSHTTSGTVRDSVFGSNLEFGGTLGRGAGGQSSGSSSSSQSSDSFSSSDQQSSSDSSSDSQSDSDSDSDFDFDIQTSGDADGRAGLQRMMQQLIQLRQQNAGNPMMLQAIDELIRQMQAKAAGGRNR